MILRACECKDSAVLPIVNHDLFSVTGWDFQILKWVSFEIALSGCPAKAAFNTTKVIPREVFERCG